MYTNVESLCYTPDTSISYVSFTLKGGKRKSELSSTKNFFFFFFVKGRREME